MSEEQTMNKEDNKYDEFGFFNPFSVRDEEKSEDCISRQAAIDIVVCDILSSAIVYGRTEEGMSARKAIVDGLKRLPPVTPAEKVGHWIKLDNCSNSGYYCSECQKRVVKEGWSDTVKTIKYCPNCGAKMQGVKE